MSYIYSEVRLYKRAGDKDGGWESTYTTLTNTFNKLINIGLGTVKDTARFDILNSNNKYFVNNKTFETGDKVEFYYKLNSSTIVSSDLMFIGVINEVKEEIGQTNILHIGSKSLTEQMLEGVSIVTTTSNLTPPEILSYSLNFHNQNNNNFELTWKSTNTSTKEDGSAFPTYEVAEYYKSMNQLFEQYSGNNYTKDGNYYWYINNNNEVVWEKKKNEPIYNIGETETQSISISNNSDSVINSVIIYCGNFPGRQGIRSYYFDFPSRSQYGAKWKWLTAKNDTCQNLITKEKETNPSSFDSQSTSPYPKSASYPYTTSFGVSCATDAEFAKAIENRAISKAKEYAKDYCQHLNYDLINARVTLPLTLNYTIGAVCTCDFPYYGVNNTNLRIKSIQYGDYTTTLDLTEDEAI